VHVTFVGNVEIARSLRPVFRREGLSLKPVGLAVSSPGRSRFGKPWEYGVFSVKPRQGRPCLRSPLAGLETNRALIPGLRSKTRSALGY